MNVSFLKERWAFVVSFLFLACATVMQFFAHQYNRNATKLLAENAIPRAPALAFLEQGTILFFSAMAVCAMGVLFLRISSIRQEPIVRWPLYLLLGFYACLFHGLL